MQRFGLTASASSHFALPPLCTHLQMRIGACDAGVTLGLFIVYALNILGTLNSGGAYRPDVRLTYADVHIHT